MQIAYDISFLVHNYLYGNRRSGVYRVIYSVLQSLRKRGDLNIGLVCTCHHNPLYASILFDKHLSRQMNLSGADYIDTVKSRVVNVDLFHKFYDTRSEKLLQLYSPLTLRTLPLRASLRAIEYLQKMVLYQTFASQDVQVFHSPFWRLPPQKITGPIPRVLTIYDLIPVLAPQYVTEVLTQFMKNVIEGIDIDHDYVICISQHTKKEFINYTHMSPDRVFVVPLAADDSFQPTADESHIKRCKKLYRIPEGDYFLTLAEMQPRKNLARLIEAFIHFLEKTKKKDTYLVLVGSFGWENDAIFRAINRFSDHKEKIIVTGYVEDEHLAAIYSGAMMFIYPSLYEGFGLPPLEAMQCGVPVIAANSTSIPEVVGDAGILVDPLDINEISDSIYTLYNSESLRKEFRERGLQRAKLFSWTKCADDTVNVYQTATKK